MFRKSGILLVAQCLLTRHCISQKTTLSGVNNTHTGPWPGISRKISACERLWNHYKEVIPKGPLLDQNEQISIPEQTGATEAGSEESRWQLASGQGMSLPSVDKAKA